MKALFISNDARVFIEGSSVQARMQEYAAAIGELHIIGRGTDTKITTIGGLTLHSVAVSKFLAPFVLPRAARAVCVKYGIEIVSAQDPFEYGLMASKAVQGTQAKLHLQLHTDVFSKWFTMGATKFSPYAVMPALNRVRQHLADRLLPRADGIRVVSERIKESLERRFGSKLAPIRVIPIAPSAALPAPVAFPPDHFTFRLVTVGRLEAEKRVDDIFAAFALVKDRYPTLGLYLVGDGRERARLKKLAVRLGLKTRIVFLGEREDALGLMQSADLFIQASAYEGYGRTLIEAALARIPIITTDVGIVGEVLRPLEDVLVSPPGDPNALSFNIVRLMESVQDRTELIAHAAQTVEEHLRTVRTGPDAIATDLAETLARTRTAI